jgi:hypothetical protein
VSEITTIIRDLEQQHRAIEKAVAALRAVSDSLDTFTVPSSTAAAPRKRQMTAQGRQRIIEATKRRWANKRAADAKAARKEAKNIAGKKSAPPAVKKSASKRGTAKKPKKRPTKAIVASVKPVSSEPSA